MNAALTGHLVLTTLHTNSTVGVIPRLIDMGVDPYLIAPTLIIAIAQRLVSVLCPDSKEAVPVDGAIRMMIDKQLSDLPEEVRGDFVIPAEVYRARPSPSCAAGTKGRQAVFEVLSMDRDVEKLILTNPSESEIARIARAKGMTTMKEDALRKIFQGVVPFEELAKL